MNNNDRHRMMPSARVKILIAVCAAAACHVASAQSAPEAATVKPLLVKGTCLGGHAVDKKVVGPAYHEVAAKYQGDPKAVDLLAEKIVKGGAGVWGPIPMPAASAITPAEAKILAAWMLAGAPAN